MGLLRKGMHLTAGNRPAIELQGDRSSRYTKDSQLVEQRLSG